MKNASVIFQWIPVISMALGAVFFVSQIDKQVSIATHEVNYMQERINRLESRQVRMNESQDAELQKYWDNLELRMGEMQKIQFEQRCANAH